MRLTPFALAAALLAGNAYAAPELIAIGGLSGMASDLSGLNYNLENGVSASMLGGMGSGLAWAGGSTFLALPDRGPNALPYMGLNGSTANTVDDTTSYIPRFQTVNLALTKSASGNLPYTLTPTLTGTTLLYSTTPLNYGSTANLASGVPALNAANPGKYYFTGRSDGFAGNSSALGSNARLDPEGIRVSNNGKTVYISDEYGPYLYAFDRATGARTATIALPGNLAVANQSANGATEISGNTSGRVANKGMEGLAITPDGNTLVGFMQSPLIQDSNAGAGNQGKGQYNRIVTVDLTDNTTHEYAYDNLIGTKTYNSSEILAINSTQFLVLERDGNGLGDGSNAAIKQLRLVDIAGATDITSLSGASAIKSFARSTTLFLDLYKSLNAAGIPAGQIPSKLEGAAFGQDIVDNGVTFHTLYIANDNDFAPDVAGDNKFFVFRFTDADLSAVKPGATFVNQTIAAVPEPSTYALVLGGLAVVGAVRRRQR